MPAYYDEEKKHWYVMFYAKDYKGDNKKYKKTGFKKKKDAQEYEAEFKRKVSGTINMSFQSLYEEYIIDFKKRHKLSTTKRKETHFRLYILPFFGNMSVNSIAPNIVRKWQNEMMDKNTTKGTKFSKNTLRGIHISLKSIFNFAKIYYNLKENPCDGLKPLGSRKADTEMKIWSLEDFNKFMSSFDKEKHATYRIIFLILFWTGMRVGELKALTWADINFDTKIININKTQHIIDGKEIITSPKTEGSVREIIIPDLLYSELKDYYSITYKPSPRQKLISLSVTTLRYNIEKYSLKAGVEKIRLHDLRHSHASYLIYLQADIAAISKRLGHDNIQTTLNTYGHMYHDAQQKLVDKLNSNI